MIKVWFKSFLATVLPIIVVVLLWELAYYIDFENVKLFPSPSIFLEDVAKTNFKIGIGAQATSITESILSSVFRVFAGLFLGFAVALIVGFLISSTGS